jgi:sulfur relay (sulfurtransferase) DsrC/TusE family protein
MLEEVKQESQIYVEADRRWEELRAEWIAARQEIEPIELNAVQSEIEFLAA